MATRNSITGDFIRSKANSKDYRDNWDVIFGKDEKDTEEQEEVDDKALTTKSDEK